MTTNKLNRNKTQRQNNEQKKRMAQIERYTKEIAQVNETPKLLKLKKELAPLKKLTDADNDEELPNSYYLRVKILEHRINQIKNNNREYTAYLRRKIQNNSY